MLSVRLRREPASRSRPRLGAGRAVALRPLFAGDETSLWRAPDGENYTVMVRLPLDDRTGVADLQRIWFTAAAEPDGLPRMVHIAQIADIVPTSAPRRSTAAISTARSRSRANVSGRSPGEVSSDLQKITGRHQAAAGLPLRVRRLDQGHAREPPMPARRCSWR